MLSTKKIRKFSNPKVTFKTTLKTSITFSQSNFVFHFQSSIAWRKENFYVIFSHVNNISPLAKNQCQFLLIVLFHPSVNENGIIMLIDTGAAMNVCNLFYHLWVMLEYSEIVGESFQYCLNTKNDVVQLLAALELNTNQRSTIYEKITAVIRYRTS